MIVYAISFLLFLCGFYIIKLLVRSGKNDAGDIKVPIPVSRTALIIIAAGIIFRITLIPANPSTSDDVYRYIWEGKILSSGYNPFEYPPDDERLNHLHSAELPSKVTFPSMTTIYPAIAQYTFAAAYSMTGENGAGLKIIYLIAELVTFIFIIKILRIKKLNTAYVLLYAWLPLPIMEYFINSHIDVIGIAFFTVFIFYVLKNNYLIAAIPFSLAVLTKILPLFFLPLLFKKFRLIKLFVFTLAAFIICTLIMYPLVPAEKSVNESLFTYLSTWSFNGSLYSLLSMAFSDSSVVRSILLIVFMVFVGNIALRYDDFLKAVYGVWICYIVFAATLYPWYLGWISAVNPFYSFSSVMSLLFTVNLTNFSPLGNVWKEFWWVLVIQYVPFYLFLIKDFYNPLSDWLKSKWH